MVVYKTGNRSGAQAAAESASLSTTAASAAPESALPYWVGDIQKGSWVEGYKQGFSLGQRAGAKGERFMNSTVKEVAQTMVEHSERTKALDHQWFVKGFIEGYAAGYRQPDNSVR